MFVQEEISWVREFCVWVRASGLGIVRCVESGKVVYGDGLGVGVFFVPVCSALEI